MKKTLFVILGTGIFLFCLFIVFTFSTIHRQVKEITTTAVNEYKLSAVESLASLIKSENHSYKEKNSAIWALGQFADRKALPFLEELNSQTAEKSSYSRERELSKYEIEKAIKWCRQGNWTSWMYKKINKQPGEAY